MWNVEPVISDEGGADAVVVPEEASLFPRLGPAALTPFIELSAGGLGDIDVDAIAAAAAPPTEDPPAPGGIGPDEAVAPNPAGGGGGGAPPPPAA